VLFVFVIYARVVVVTSHHPALFIFQFAKGRVPGQKRDTRARIKKIKKEDEEEKSRAKGETSLFPRAVVVNVSKSSRKCARLQSSSARIREI